MRKLFLILHLFLQNPGLFGQKTIETFIRHNTFTVSTISPDSINYLDLEVIGKSIDDAQIVMLGEQDHGDAATFLAKTRLVKYLHEKKGFNVLAFESDFFGLNYGLQNPQEDKLASDSLLRNNILSLWANCHACADLLYKYIPAARKTNNPISITGFDSQINYTNSRKLLVKSLDSVLHSLDIQTTKQANYKSEILPMLHGLITRFWYRRPADSMFIHCGKALQVIKEQTDRKIENNSIWSIVIDNLIAFNSQLEYLKKDMWKAESIRDKQMYLNLKWLLQKKYANQKVIVWAANNHVSRFKNNRYASMGSLLSLDKSFHGKVYTIGFTSYFGRSGRLYENQFTINKPKRNSFESWIDPSIKYAFVDFKEFNKRFPDSEETFNLRAWRYRTSNNKWNQIFDGIWYIKEMYACEVNQTSR